MTFEPINNTINISKKIAYQYSASSSLIKYIGVLLAPFDELEQVFADILNKRTLEDSAGLALDNYGTILDQQRESYNATDFPFFGLDASDLNNPVKHYGLGDLNDITIGGILRSIEQPIGVITKLTDTMYRQIIKGKIHQNNFKGGCEELISAIESLLGITSEGSFQVEEIFTEASDPYVRITFYVPLTLAQKNFLEIMDILPKPGGIRYEYVYN